MIYEKDVKHLYGSFNHMGENLIGIDNKLIFPSYFKIKLLEMIRFKVELRKHDSAKVIGHHQVQYTRKQL